MAAAPSANPDPAGDAAMIRSANDADIPAMHRIRLAVRENRLGNPDWIGPDDYRAMLTEQGRGWVAEVNGQIAGFAVADRTRWNVWALFVDPDHERRGIGRHLHHAMMQWFFDAGAQSVWLGTDPGTRAEAFYRAAGWRAAGSLPNGEVRYEMSRDDWLARPAPRPGTCV